MADLDSSDLIRILASGAYICTSTYPEACRELANDDEMNAIREYVQAGLDYLGMQLKASSGKRPDYFYAAPLVRRLDKNGDLPELRKELNAIIKGGTGYLGFIEFIDKATGVESLPDTGYSFDLGCLQSALANTTNTALQEVFVKVLNTRYFKTALKSRLKNDKERLDEMIQKLEQDGLIVGDGTGVNFEFTGRFAHYITIIERIKDSLSPDEDENEPPMSQKALID